VRWVKVEDKIRINTTNTTLNDASSNNYKVDFINKSGNTTINGLTVAQRQSLTNALKPQADN
jgi:hypothetical protein